MKVPNPKTKQISPDALLQAVRLNLLRVPLFHPETVMNLLDITRDQVKAKIEDGTFFWAFEVGQSKRRSEPRILALSVVEQQLGPLPAIGATRNLKLPQVIDLILAARDLRSTEIKKLFACGNDWLRDMKPNFVVVQGAKSTSGPNSYTVFSRASVADWLGKRRMT